MSLATKFDAAAFLTSAGLGRRIVRVKAKQFLFAQGNPADSVFYLQKGRAKLTLLCRKAVKRLPSHLSLRAPSWARSQLPRRLDPD